jgi:hypothetical protein
MADCVRGSGLTFDEAIEKHGLSGEDAKQTRIFSYMARQVWSELATHLRVLAVEDKLTHDVQLDAGTVRITGHADVICEVKAEPNAIALMDWKTGRRRNHTDQLLTYGLLGLHEWPEAEQAICVPVWVRERTYEYHRVSPDDLDEYRARLRWAVENADVYNPGPQCEFCPHRYTCDARHAEMREAVAALDETEPQELEPEHLASLRPQARALRDALRTYKKVLKQTLREHGPIPIGDGQELYLNEYTAEPVDLQEALPVLADELDGRSPGETLNKIMDALKVSKSDLLQIFADKAEYGEKGDEKERIMTRLREAGAVEEIEKARVQTRSVQQGDE